MRPESSHARQLRIGLTAPEDPLARRLREVFRDENVPVSRFVELGSESQAGKFSEKDGDFSFIQTPSRETVGDLDLLLLNGSDADAAAERLAKENEVPIFRTDASTPAALGPEVVLMRLSPPPREAGFTIIVPASERGEAGVEELFAQAGDALNFRQTPTRVFAARLAFNVFRDDAILRQEETLRSRLHESFPATTINILCVRAALFHGYAAAASLRFETEEAARTGAEQLQKSTAISFGRGPGHATAGRAVESEAILADPAIVAGPSLSFLFTYDGLTLAARRAVEAARRLLGQDAP